MVKLAREKGIAVVPIPGASAVITALSAAGIPCDAFSFGGFLPAKTSARQEALRHWQRIDHTLVFYESPHRLKSSLQDIGAVFGVDCALVLVKELTKTFETFFSGRCEEILAWLNADPVRGKGEFVLILPPRTALDNDLDSEKILRLLLKELPLKRAVVLASQLSDTPKNALYDLALRLTERTPHHDPTKDE